VLPEIAALGAAGGGKAKSVIGVLRAARIPQIAIEGRSSESGIG
jgi:hypothetical protein